MSYLQAGNVLLKVFMSTSNQYNTKRESEKLYKTVVPAIKHRLNQGEAFESEGVQRDIEALLMLPPNGARRLNFERRYLINENTFRQLPDDPENLSIAYWW